MTGEMDPEARLAWQDVSDDELDLSVADVVAAAEAVAEGANSYANDQYAAGRVDAALETAELLLNQHDRQD